VPRNIAFCIERKRLRIYLSHDKEKDVQERKEQAADLSESQGTGCPAAEKRCRLRIYLNHDKRSRIFMRGRNKLQIYRSAKEQGVQGWKEEVADLSECRGTGGSVVEKTGCRSI
jgi:hypothetical protein